jgi:ArsR family transcriptional regulator
MPDARLFELHAQVCKTLANPWRLRLIDALRTGERSVADLVRALGVPKANVSQHLGVMRAGGVVESRREGAFVYYRLADPRIVDAFRLMREVLLGRLRRTGELAKRARRSAA